MVELLKDMFFTDDSLRAMADTIEKYYPDFNKKRFLEIVHDENWVKLELKERMRHTTKCLYELLPKEYPKALEILQNAAPYIKGFESMTLPDYVELYGMSNWELSLPALKHFTQFSSSEFAIRPFLNNNLSKAMDLLVECADDQIVNVRRFASEGCRPRLPWAMSVPMLKKSPAPIIPILEKLKNDKSEFVRRSVANNLNDISKDHPDLALDIFEKWYGENKNVDWIVKHACRTLLKAGNKRAMKLFGYADPSQIGVQNFILDPDRIKIGDSLNFAFELFVKEKDKTKLRLEYAIYYKKASGKLSKKVFKITENAYLPGIHPFSKKQSFKNMSTRKHYPGVHYISIIVNGVEKEKKSIDLLT